MKDQILGTASVVDGDGLIYSVGSFGGRVNFYAQQNRALNLVWALVEDGQLRPDEDAVAVIGCGITGLTLAAGLIAHKIRVDVFESGDALIPRQLDTQHRMGHPTINYWPTIAPDLTTRLPFLEWHFGKCEVIATDLLSQFDNLRARFETGKNTPSQTLIGVTADRILPVAANLVMVKSDGGPDESYRLVIIAVGFGKEVLPDKFGTPEYWSPDDLERERNVGKYKYYIVSGSGDGGLIDALRIVHPDFQHGQLAFEIAAELYDTEVATIIKDAEKVAANAKDHDSAALEKAYRRAAEILVDDRTYAESHRKLWDSLKRFKRLVYVTDQKWAKPFSRNAAPIHKLMLAHAKRMARVEYGHGVIEDDRENYSIGGVRLAKVDTKVITRHGSDPEPTLRHLLSEAQFQDLKKKQSVLADHVITPHWQPFPCVEDMPAHDPASDAFKNSRMDMAEDTVRQINPRAKLLQVPGGFEVTFRQDVPAIARGPLFGIPTTYMPTAVSVGLPG